jgi:hypothetical protein
MFVHIARNIHCYLRIFIDAIELYKLMLIGDIKKNAEVFAKKNAEVTLLLLTSKLPPKIYETTTSTRIPVHN